MNSALLYRADPRHAELGDGFLEGLPIDVGQNDAHATRGKRFGHAKPNAAGASRDEGDSSLELIHEGYSEWAERVVVEWAVNRSGPGGSGYRT